MAKKPYEPPRISQGYKAEALQANELNLARLEIIEYLKAIPPVTLDPLGHYDAARDARKALDIYIQMLEHSIRISA